MCKNGGNTPETVQKRGKHKKNRVKLRETPETRGRERWDGGEPGQHHLQGWGRRGKGGPGPSVGRFWGAQHPPAPRAEAGTGGDSGGEQRGAAVGSRGGEIQLQRAGMASELRGGTAGGHPGATQESPRSHPGATQEPPRWLVVVLEDEQVAPRGHLQPVSPAGFMGMSSGRARAPQGKVPPPL